MKNFTKYLTIAALALLATGFSASSSLAHCGHGQRSTETEISVERANCGGHDHGIALNLDTRSTDETNKTEPSNAATEPTGERAPESDEIG